MAMYNKLVNASPQMKVYLKKDIPERYHLKNHRRTAPILVVPELGYRIQIVSTVDY